MQRPGTGDVGCGQEEETEIASPCCVWFARCTLVKLLQHLTDHTYLVKKDLLTAMIFRDDFKQLKFYAVSEWAPEDEDGLFFYV